MAKLVENIFVDVTGLDEKPYIAQHQKLFPGNVIARFEIDGRTYLKVPYLPSERTRAAGLSLQQFSAVLPEPEPIDKVISG